MYMKRYNNKQMASHNITKFINHWNKLPKRSEYSNLKVYFNNNHYHIIEIPKDANKIKLEIVNSNFDAEEEENAYLTRMSNQHVIKF
jgi:hypothetical protein